MVEVDLPLSLSLSLSFLKAVQRENQFVVAIVVSLSRASGKIVH